VTAHTPAIMPQHGRACRGGVPGNGWSALQRSVHVPMPHEPHARGTRPTISAVCLCVSMRSVRLRHAHAVRPVALGVRACLLCGVPPATAPSSEQVQRPARRSAEALPRADP
jgi:hypothetical protein